MASLQLTAENLQKLFGKQTPPAQPDKSSRRSNRSKSSGRSRKSSRGSRRSKSGPAKRRVKSENGTRVVFAHQGRIAGMVKDQILKNLAPTVGALTAARKKAALGKSGYFDAKDVKTDLVALQKEVDQLEKEFALLKNTLRAGLGDRPIRMRLTTSFVITTTVTTGVTNTVVINGSANKLDPSLTSEWSTMAALFDEYKCLGGEVVVVYGNTLAAVGSAPVTSNSLPVMAYDPDSSSAAASSLVLTQMSQHKILPNCSTTGVGDGLNHRFRWHVPRGTTIGAGSGGYPGTEWIVTGVTQGAGYLLFYHVGTGNTAIDNGAGVVYFDLEFRCRS